MPPSAKACGNCWNAGEPCALATTEEDSVYRLYYDFEQSLSRLQGHQILAINRGEKEEKLKATVLLDRELALPLLRRAVVKPGSAAMEFVKTAAEDALFTPRWSGKCGRL